MIQDQKVLSQPDARTPANALLNNIDRGTVQESSGSDGGVLNRST